MNAYLRRRGLLAAVIFVLLLVSMACTAPGYGGGGNAASGAPAAAPVSAPTAAPYTDPYAAPTDVPAGASPAKGRYGY